MERGSEPRRVAGVLLVALALLALWPASAAAQDVGAPEGSLDEVGQIESGGESVDGGTSLRGERQRPWQRTQGRGTQARGEARGSFGNRYLKTLGWLVLVVALAVGAVFLLRRIMPGSIHPQNRNLVQVIGRGTLGPKHHVVVTRIGERILILGLTSDSIVRLGEVDDPREAIRMTPTEETFAGRVTLSEAAYREEDAARGDLDDSNLEPYRREIDRLRGMVEVWQKQGNADRERGSA